MKGGLLVKEARRRAGLSQRALAERLDTSQSVVARWENGARSPSFDSVVRAVRACGFDLSVSLPPHDDDHDIGLAAGQRSLPPERRLDLIDNFGAIEEWALELRQRNRIGPRT